MPAPLLRTARLTLEAHTAEDLDACVAMWADPAVTAFIGGKPATREETWARLLRYAGHWALMPYGYWAIRETATGRFVGDAGLADWRREADPSFAGTPEGGWALAPWSHGQGYAREALTAVLAWADTQRLARTVCIIDPANTRSIRLAELLGYRRAVEVRYKGSTTQLFERFT